MKNINTIIPSLLLLGFLIHFSNLQAQDTLFYDEDWKEIENRSEATYYSLFKKEGKNWTTENYFVSNDQLHHKGYYDSKKKKQAIGSWTYFWESGNKRREFSFLEGEMDGVFKRWHENGQLEEEGNYKEGSQVGVWKTWYDNGNKQSIIDQKEPDFGEVLSFWYKDGRAGVVDGNGSYEVYGPVGEIIISGEVRQGKREGEYKSFYPTGEVFEIVNFENNQAQGSHKYFYKNGKLEAEGIEKKNQKAAMWNFYDRKGEFLFAKNFDEEGIADQNKDFSFRYREPYAVNVDLIKRMIGYPQAAIQAGIQGQVICRVLLDRDGNYLKHKFIDSSPKVFKKAISEHIGEVRFTRTMMEAKPIKYWVNIPFSFKLLN